MNPSENIGVMAESFLDGNMSPSELRSLEKKRKDDPKFAEDFQETLEILIALREQGKRQAFRNEVKSTAKNWKSKPLQPEKPMISMQTHYFRTALVAATIALATSLGSFWLVQNYNRQLTSQYRLLKKDIENYKRHQIQSLPDTDRIIPDPARFTGTGFAIANNGYLVTNYHLTEGADSIFIQTREDQHIKTRLVAVDQKNDVAILQVDDPQFTFSNQEIPYVIKESKRPLGTPIFTLGFPQEEVVYHEGYVSSSNGFQGDSMQYRLNLPSAPGQSGAPVLDRSGLLIGIITGKESLSEGTTYAVCTQALLDLIDQLPSDETIQLPRKNRIRGLSPEQQIKKIEPFTFAVKVYKK